MKFSIEKVNDGPVRLANLPFALLVAVSMIAGALLLGMGMAWWMFDIEEPTIYNYAFIGFFLIGFFNGVGQVLSCFFTALRTGK